MPISAGATLDLTIRPARDIASFVRAPANRFVARRCFCFWQLDTDMKGLIAWGEPTADDAVEMTRAFEAGAREGELHRSLVDMRSLRTIDVAAFEVIRRYMAARAETFSRTVLRQVLVHGTGAAGAAVAGFFRVVQPAYPVESFGDFERALEWLAPPDPVRVRAIVTGLRRIFVDAPPVVAGLRAALESAGRAAPLAVIARQLGRSRRSLQRELAAAGSSFRRELSLYRLARAEQLLAGTRLPVKSVAAEVDLAPARLTALFRENHGVTPAAWRNRFARVAGDATPSSVARRPRRPRGWPLA